MKKYKVKTVYSECGPARPDRTLWVIDNIPLDELIVDVVEYKET